MMKKKQSPQIKALQKALEPLDRLNPLPNSLSPERVTALLRQQEAPCPPKRRVLTLRHVAAIAAVLAIAIGAVALWKGLPYLEVTEPSGESKPLVEAVQDYSEIEAYFQKLQSSIPFQTESYARDEAAGMPAAGAAKGDSSSPTQSNAPQASTNQNVPAETPYGQTNTQVAGVDEADILKNDGSCLYFAPAGGKSIRIIAPTPVDSMQVLATIAIPQGEGESVSVAELYVRGNRLIAVCHAADTSGQEVSGQAMADAIYNGCMVRALAGDTRLLIYDIGDRSAPKLTRTFTQDGAMLSSRMIGSTLYLVTQYTVPLSSDELTDYIPTTTDQNSPAQKLAAADIRILPGADTPNYLVVSALDTSADQAEPARKAVLGSGDSVYCSTDALYVAFTEYEQAGEFTAITGFPLTEEGLGESVSGRVRGRALNQFSLDSYGGALRIATTETVDGATSSRVTILDRSLNTLSTLGGIAPGESIYAVRFLGNKGYVVTFRQTDPLFVLDLSDTSAPKILGQLKIPGFSSYLHPVGEGLLLGIGEDADDAGNTRGVKLSLFDVSDPAKPQEIDSLTLGRHTYTDAASNHKSILFLPEQSAVALPIMQQESMKDFQIYSDQTYCVFSLEGNQIQLMHTLRNYTREAQFHERRGKDNAILRGTYIGSTLYTFSNGRVCAFSLDSGVKRGQLDF